MALTYTEFDTTTQNLVYDLVNAILASSDWAKITPTASVLTTSTATAVSGTVLTFTSTAAATTAGWGIGTVIRIGAAGAVDTENKTITAISGTTITVAAMSFAHAIGTNVYPGSEVLKATTTRGADMIIDLQDAHLATGYTSLSMACWTSHTGTVGINKASRYLYWRSTGGLRADQLHVVVSAGKEHLFFSVEGPRVGETNPENASFGSPREYMFLCDMVPYHASDTTACVFAGGSITNTYAGSYASFSHLGQLSRNHAGVAGWSQCKLFTLGFTGYGGSGASSGINAQRNTVGDGNLYLFPHVCISEPDGVRGRLAAFFNAGQVLTEDLIGSPPPAVGAKVTYGGKTYKLLAVNRGGAANPVWAQLGLASNGTTQLSASPVVAVLST